MATTGLGIIIVSFLLIGITILILYFLIGTDPSPGGSTGLGTCPVGQCVTDITTGVKTCPPTGSTGAVIITTDTQVCNSPYGCESGLTPYPLLSTGATSNNSSCEPNVICRCLNKPQCSEFITGIFTQDTSPFDQINIYQQPSVNTQSTFGITTSSISIDPPIQYAPDKGQVCTLSLTALGGVDSNLRYDATLFQVQNNRSLQSQIWPRICLKGTLAYIPPIGQLPNVTSGGIVNDPVGCVRGPYDFACIDGYPYWDYSSNSVQCMNL